MSNRHIQRINPSRPFNSNKAGLKRIALTKFAQPSEQKSATKPLRTPTKIIEKLLVVVHSEAGMLDMHARQTIAAAAILASAHTAVVVLVLGELREDLADAGADEVMVIPQLDYLQYQPDTELACVNAVIASVQPVRIFLPDNLIGDGDLGRRLIANSANKTAATYVVEVNAARVSCYQKGGAQLVVADLPALVLIAPDIVDSKLPFVASAVLKDCTNLYNANLPSHKRYQDLGLEKLAASEVALEEADFVVSAGNGVNHVETFTKLALTLDAAIGASRVAVDDGKFTRDKQIGATGKTVTARTYLAIGISGAVQHLQGIRDCRHVIVINRDSSAPIVKRANLSIIGDAEEVMQNLIQLVTAAKATQELTPT
ncbi:MAG: electron transfer flavoprotein subunit alpha/FixB family protein [Methylophilaceae bacterium]